MCNPCKSWTAASESIINDHMMVASPVPLNLETVDSAYEANSMYFLFVIGAWCAADLPSLCFKVWKPEPAARIVQESDGEYSLSTQISHHWTEIWCSVKRIWFSTSYILLMHWVVLQDWSSPPTHDIFAQLEILLSSRLKLGLRRRQRVWFGRLRRSDNRVHAFCFPCQFFSSDLSNGSIKKGLRRYNYMYPIMWL